MIDALETLRLLAREGTMTGAATRLRLTQSAVSKRIRALEEQVGKKLVAPSGRRVKLTPAGLRLLQRVEPLLAELRTALQEEAPEGATRIRLAVSESVLSSWGAHALRAVGLRIPGLELELHAHRSLGVLDRVRSGDCMLGICAGVAEDAPDLSAEVLGEEEFCLVPAALDRKALPRRGQVAVMTIESGSATWSVLGRRLKRAQASWPFSLEIRQTLQSFSCLVELARAGHGHALVPRATALAAGIGDDQLVRLPQPGLARPVSLVGRPSMLAQPGVRAFADALRAASRDLLVRR
jgi:DNA-binding transcriptional LysR family regulator